jgi:branched-chain amino acid transport system substrate-binding protein
LKLFALITLFFLGFLFCSRAAERQIEKKIIKIGVIIPLSGNSAFIGEDIRNGFELAREQSRPSGYDIQLIYEDSQFELSKAALAAQKLINVNHVDALVSLWDAADVVAPLAEKNNILHISMRWDPEVAQKYRTTFTVECTYHEFIRSTVELMKKMGCNRIGAVRGKEKSFELCFNDLFRVAPENGLEIVSDQTFNPQERDFRTIIAKTLEKKPDIVLMMAFSPSLEILLREFREMAPRLPLTGSFEASMEKIALAEGYYFITVSAATPEFQKMFEKRYGHPFKVRAPHAYDIFNLLALIYGKYPSSKPTTETVISELTKIRDYPGALGKLTMESGRSIHFQPVWAHVLHGKMEIIRPGEVSLWNASKSF